MNKISYKALLLGILAGFVLSAVSLFFISIVIFGYDFNEMNESQVANALDNYYKKNKINDNSLLIVGSFIDALTITIAGYISARIAKVAAYLNAGLVGVFALIMSICFIDNTSPLWINISTLLYPIPSALLGGYIAITTNKCDAN